MRNVPVVSGYDFDVFLETGDPAKTNTNTDCCEYSDDYPVGLFAWAYATIIERHSDRVPLVVENRIRRAFRASDPVCACRGCTQGFPSSRFAVPANTGCLPRERCRPQPEEYNR